MAALVGAPVTSAQDSLSGTWRLATSEAETAERRASIEAATDELSFFIRSRARSRINERTAPPASLSIRVTGDRVELTGNGRTIVVTVGGPAVAVEGEDGRGEVRASRHRGHLRISMAGEGGSQTRTYLLSDDGQRLVVHVRMTPERLSTPIVFRATYRRSGAR
jgi:hypothetical protein